MKSEVIGIQRTDSHKLPQQQQHSQQNGPRVSFNRDVHVKRIGKRSNELTPIQTKNLQPPETSHLRRELPKNQTEESLLREAAHVLAQAERIKKIESLDATTTTTTNDKTKSRNKIPNKFHSLPNRKKLKTSKPISRSVSDASAKKLKKPSIFNLFSRKSDSNLSQIEEDLRFKESGGRRLQRSKSDATSELINKDRNLRKRNLSESNETIKSTPTVSSPPTQQPQQLSPIIENSQSEDYFEKQHFSKTNKDNQRNRENKITKSERVDKENSPPQQQEPQHKTTVTVVNPLNSPKDMHSSQLPAERPILTKGFTVDGMVKRLSLERFSPPPIINAPAFSYTRPNDQIIYAQLESDEHFKMKSPIRELDSPPPLPSILTPPQQYRTTFSLNNNNNSSNINNNLKYHDSSYPSHHYNKSEIFINGHDSNNNGSSRKTNYKQSMNGVSKHSSPTKWQPLNSRNLSDDDEGLGFEPRKYYEDEIAASPSNVADLQQFRARAYERSKSPSFDPPIVPVIRSTSPIETRRGRGDGMDTKRRVGGGEHLDDEFNTLRNRREILESRILSRKFHHEPETVTTTTTNYRFSTPEKITREYRSLDYDTTLNNKPKLPTPERENYKKFHKLESNEIVHKYSPERTHLDMISSPLQQQKNNDLKTSRYVHTKYYDDGSGGVKEVYEKETRVDNHGKSHTNETSRRERLDSPQRTKDQLITMAERYRLDCGGEPKSLDSQFSDVNRSSPENMKKTSDWYMTSSSLKRDKRQQRSFDKGDSGIENDFRKESFNGDLTSKWRKRTYLDNIKSCELFIKKERHHTEELHPQRKKYDFVFRERSIDDGSHFDPRLDKYPKETTTLRRKQQQEIISQRYTSPTGKAPAPPPPPPQQTVQKSQQSIIEENGTLKREKKIGGFERVKKLFSSGRKKENKNLQELRNSKKGGGKDRYMVREEEMRSRYLEYSGPEMKEPKISDISTRRRLSTPKASPILKRMPSEKTTITTTTTSMNSSTLKPSPLSLKNATDEKTEKSSSWFKSLDRKSKKKSSEKLNASSSFRTTDDDLSTLRPNKKSVYRPPPPPPPMTNGKSLRFFGDTDMESNPPSISKAATTPRNRPKITSSDSLNRTKRTSQSAYNLDRITTKPTANRTRSNSMQNLEDGIDEVDHHKRVRHHSRSRNLHNISESGSETEDRQQLKMKTNTRHSSASAKSISSKKLDKNHHQHQNGFDENSYEHYNRSPGRDITDPTRIEFRKPPLGPPKPARSADRGRTQSYSRERERLPDSSGTEGESSLHSQRSVVYLHATTVGDIPQPQSTLSVSSRRRAMSRDDINTKNAQTPMTRTVSRSVSMLAPWTPRHVRDGYEINYAQDNQQKPRANSTLPRKPNHHSANSLARSRKTDISSTSRLSRKNRAEDESSVRNSSITSASKSGISSNHHHHRSSYEKRSLNDNRRDTNSLGRRRVK